MLAAALSIGILGAHRLASQSTAVSVVSIITALFLSLAAIACAWAARHRLATTSIISAFALAGLGLAIVENRGPALNRIARLYNEKTVIPGEAIELTGTIQTEPEPAPESLYLTIRAERIGSRGIEHDASGEVLLLANVGDPLVEQQYDALELHHGARVRVMTILDREENFRNPGVLPFTEYLDRKGYDATGVIKSPLLVERLDDARVFLPLAWMYDRRARLEKQFRARFSAETAGVLDAALLGNRYNVSRGAAERFRAGGTFHVLVIAGLHISFIAAVLFFITRVFFTRRSLQFAFAAISLWMYAVAVGAHLPVMRAALMFTLVIFAPLVARRANSLNVIGAAMLGLLVWRPNDLFDPSFQLTFLSVLAIVLLAVPLMLKMQQVGSWKPTAESPFPPDCSLWFRGISEALFWSAREWHADMSSSSIRYRLFKTPIAEKLERWHVQRFLRYATQAIVLSVSVQIGMLPLLVLYFHRVSIASPLLNIFVGALMAMLGFVALCGVAVSQVSAWLAAPLIALAEKIDWLMIHLIDPFSSFGLASVRLPHYSGWAAGLYPLYFVPLGFLILGLTRWNPLRPIAFAKPNSRKAQPRSLRGTLGALAAVILLIVFHPFSAVRPDGKLHVDFLDVGQGDAALLTMPDGTTLMIDGGGRPNIWNDSAEDEEHFQRDTRSIGESVVSEYLWARGLDHVDYVIATHADADHIDGLNDVARNFKVRGAIVARVPADDSEYSRFASTMAEQNVPIQMIGAGDKLRFGEVTAEVLWPPPSKDRNAPSRNNDSIVLRFSFGLRNLLFTADIEKEGESAMLSRMLDLRSDVVKVAHHGSKTSSTESFVLATRPDWAIISVGRTSIFGHPDKNVVNRWRENGANVMTTGQRGTISVVTDGKEMSVTTFVVQ